MSASEEIRREPSADRSEEPRLQKKPYQKPSFRFERVFETSALSCGKIHATQSGCMRNRKVS
jgi:hypothetical protein